MKKATSQQISDERKNFSVLFQSTMFGGNPMLLLSTVRSCDPHAEAWWGYYHHAEGTWSGVKGETDGWSQILIRQSQRNICKRLEAGVEVRLLTKQHQSHYQSCTGEVLNQQPEGDKRGKNIQSKAKTTKHVNNVTVQMCKETHASCDLRQG